MSETETFLTFHKGQRIECVILYIDLRGSTILIHELNKCDPSKVDFIYKTFLNEMINVVKDFGGLVLDTPGDCVIAFFPCISSFLSPADNSILCGLMMIEVVRTSISSFFKVHGIPEIQCRVAADFGEVIVSNVGISKYFEKVTFFGDVMNVASKILAKTSPNTMFIGRKLLEVIHATYSSYCEEGNSLKLDDESYEIYSVNYSL